VRHLLVTNDFPPKVGGIQSYLWELWRRLPPSETTVLTTPHPGAAAFDAAQPFRIERTRASALVPTNQLRRQIDRLAAEVDARVVLLDPALPVGRLGPRLERPFGVVVHGAEVTIPGRLPGTRHALAQVLRGARVVIAAGSYPAREAEHAARCSLPVTVIPPGIDVDRFVPLEPEARAAARRRWGISPDGRVVVSVSRLVPRKGMDTLILASARLARRVPGLDVVIAGEGRDRRRLQRLIDKARAPVRLVGRVADAELPALYGSADVFAMLCRNRWFGLEQEGFGIVFLEAAACAVPQVAGGSGGSHEAVEHGVTGLVVDDPTSATATADALAEILEADDVHAKMARASRERVVAEFTYDDLADRLHEAIDAVGLHDA
jgi:phosphatidylinositol alpha-1,6-mannosyltransferase